MRNIVRNTGGRKWTVGGRVKADAQRVEDGKAAQKANSRKQQKAGNANQNQGRSPSGVPALNSGNPVVVATSAPAGLRAHAKESLTSPDAARTKLKAGSPLPLASPQSGIVALVDVGNLPDSWEDYLPADEKAALAQKTAESPLLVAGIFGSRNPRDFDASGREKNTACLSGGRSMSNS